MHRQHRRPNWRGGREALLAQTCMDTATAMGTAGTQRDTSLTSTGARADRGSFQHRGRAGARTGIDTRTLCAAIGRALETRVEVLHIDARETATQTRSLLICVSLDARETATQTHHGMARRGTTVCGGEGPATETDGSSKNELPAQHSSVRTIQACPRGRGAQTIGIDTAADTGTAGTQKGIKTETGPPADRGLRSKHEVKAGAQTGKAGA